MSHPLNEKGLEAVKRVVATTHFTNRMGEAEKVLSTYLSATVDAKALEVERLTHELAETIMQQDEEFQGWKTRAEAAEAERDALRKALEPFLNAHDQFPESVKLIDPNWKGFSLVSVQVTKDQFLAARQALSRSKEK